MDHKKRERREKMYRYIGIEDLVAGALIELIKHENTERKVSLQMLADYGAVIVRLLSDSGQNAILFLTKESTYDFVHDYADYFSIKQYDGLEYIELNENITLDMLQELFRRNITVDLAKALFEKESIQALNIPSFA